ncbi:S-adenosyl-L-methionine-dependent methyltransferase [Lipomyces oligophaga]|uniref:S-adenosyl-L-methionine-dependent methyltransferase n=1 Tax=Lipomyces oligophaga TaxID=45792 RepID=UPI0034CF7868
MMADLQLSEVNQLQTVEYWDGRYKKDETEITFDWFKSFHDLEPFFRKYMDWNPAKKILMLGCGNSTLSKDLYDSGLRRIVNVDFSPTCIQRMKETYPEPEMTWQVMDVRDMSMLDDSSFDYAIDKGTLDALLSYTGSVWTIPDDVKANTDRYMSEICRVLKPGGSLLYVSYRQPHFAKPVLQRSDWNVEVDVLADQAGGFEYFGYNVRKNH